MNKLVPLERFNFDLVLLLNVFKSCCLVIC